MDERKKLICQNPNHPFRQKWYWYVPIKGEMSHLADERYCTSCASYLNMLKTVFKVLAFSPQATLYGEKFIKTDKEQLIQLIRELDDV